MSSLRNALALTIILTVLVPMAQAQMFQSVPADEATLIQEGPGKLYCPSCGMNLVTFYKTSHTLNGQQFCSMHCLVDGHEDLTGAMVVDAASLKLIPAAEAHYVVGSDVKGTMTMVSKYAFADASAAEAFAAEHGGTVMDFPSAVEKARANLAKEKKMVGKKREAMAEKGAKIYEGMCGQAKLPRFGSIAEAKTYLSQHHPCGELKDPQYQALAIYLVRQQSGHTHQAITAPEGAKCPVCGMFPALYPNWLAAVESTGGETFYFDGVKDMLKFSFEPSRYHAKLAPKDLKRLRVTDYYDLGALDARQAWFVVGSNVFGPMGNELIPFRSREEAQVFSDDHFGKSILAFDEITQDLVLDLDK